MATFFEMVGAALAFVVIKCFQLMLGALKGLARAVPRARAWAKPIASATPVVAEAPMRVALPRRVVNLAIKPGFTVSVSIHPEGEVEAVLRSAQPIGGRTFWFVHGTRTDAAGLGAVIASIEKAAYKRIIEVEAEAAAAQAVTATSEEAPKATAEPRVLEKVVQPEAKAQARKAKKADKPAVAARKPVAVGKVIEASMVPSAMHPEGLFTLVVDDPTGEPRLLRGPAVQDAWERSCLEVGDSIRASKELTQPGAFQMATGSVSTDETPVYFIEKEGELV